MLLDLRQNIVDLSERILRKSGLNDKIICLLLRVLHYGISIITLIILLVGPKKWFILVVLLNLFVFILYFIFGGCILSKIEHRFTKDEFTVIDPLLILLHIELTNKNRYYYSLISNIFGSILMGIIYYIRFVGASEAGASEAGASEADGSEVGASKAGASEADVL